MTNFWDFALRTNERTNGQNDELSQIYRTPQQARVSNKLDVGTFLWAGFL